MIYFIQAGKKRDPVKIGWSEDVEGRLRVLQNNCPFKLTLIRRIDSPRWAEKWLHKSFAEARLWGEWFCFRKYMLTILPPNEKPAKVATGPTTQAIKEWIFREEGPKVVRTSADLRAWAHRMRLTPSMAARIVGLSQSGYNAKIYGRHPPDRRTALLAAYYEDDPLRAERVLATVEDGGPP